MIKTKFNGKNIKLKDLGKELKKSIESNIEKQLEEKFKSPVNLEDNQVKVELQNIFTPDFITNATSGKFASVEDFLKAVNVLSSEDYENLPQEELDQHVAKYTNCQTWQELFEEAVY